MENFGSALASLAGILAFASLLALTNERIIEHGIKPLLVRLKIDSYTGQISMLTGTGIAFLFWVDLYAPLARAIGMTPIVNWAGVLLTGLVIGGGSNLLNDLWPMKSTTSKTTKEITVTETTSEPVVEPLPTEEKLI